MRLLLICWLLLTVTATATDYTNRLSNPAKGGDPNLSGTDSPVPSQEPLPDNGSAPAIIPVGEASESRSPLPDETAPPPFDPQPYVHRLQVGEWFGSGTYLGDGLFITCGHLFKDNPSLVVKIDGKQYGGTLHMLFDVDLAYIQMRGIPTDWPEAQARIMEMADGLEVSCYGMESKLHKATIDRKAVIDGGAIWCLSQKHESVIPGDSGGGAFDSAGHLLGVIVADEIKGDHIILRPLTLEKGRFPTHPNIIKIKTPVSYAKIATGVGVLLFTATWCGPCHTAHEVVLPDIEKAGYKVDPIDFDTKKDLVNQYHVTHIPTWIILKDGQEVGRYTGIDTSLLKNLLAQQASHP